MEATPCCQKLFLKFLTTVLMTQPHLRSAATNTGFQAGAIPKQVASCSFQPNPKAAEPLLVRVLEILAILSTDFSRPIIA